MFYSTVEINLSRIRQNYESLCGVFPDKILAPMLKSNAYGHGAKEVALTLQKGGCTHFCVFSVDEAKELREAGIAARLWVVGGCLPEEYSDAASLGGNTALALWDPKHIPLMSRYAMEHHLEFQLHLKIDTGMSRLGVFPEDVPEVLQELEKHPGLRLCGAFSHLASADEPENPQTALQVSRFMNAVSVLPADCREIHLCASPGLLAGAAAELNYCRPGLPVYGYDFENLRHDIKLEPAMGFKSLVTSVKTVKAGERVSYGGIYHIADSAQRLAVIPVGYDHGVPRQLSNRGAVLIHGQRAPIRGRICMGMMMADVTAVSDVKQGDEVVILGQQGNECINASEIASLSGTIAHDILCRFGKNTHRIFIS